MEVVREGTFTMVVGSLVRPLVFQLDDFSTQLGNLIANLDLAPHNWPSKAVAPLDLDPLIPY
jgi:hypothetical protein